MRNRVVLAIFLTSLIVGSGLRGRDLLLPYENGHRGATAAFFALMAKNHLRHGFQTTGGVGVLNPVRVDSEYFHYYLHHPPGTIWIATLGGALGGTTPAGLRLVFLPFSIGIILLVYRLGRSRGRRVAAGAAAIAAMVPIATYYGAFVNFELPTLFFSLLTLHLYERYRRRGRRRDQMRCLFAFSAAVFCDWIALGIPICVWILSWRTPKVEEQGDKASSATGHHPLLRSKLLARNLLGAGTAVVIVVKSVYAYQVSRFGVDPTPGFGYYLQVTPFGAAFDAGMFWANISTYLETWYGSLRHGLDGSLSLGFSPLLILAALGLLPALLRLLKRKLDGLDVAAFTVLAMGVANLAVLAVHASKHDYYVFYLFPAVALLAGATLGHLPKTGKPRMIFPIVLVALLGHLYVEGEAAHDERSSTVLSEYGERVGKHTAQEAVVILPNFYTLQVAVTANRLVLDANSVDRLEWCLDQAVNLGHAGRPAIFLLPKTDAESLDAGLMETLRERAAGPAEERGPFLAFDLGLL